MQHSGVSVTISVSILHTVSEPRHKVGTIGVAIEAMIPASERPIMNIASVFEWFAQASTQLAEENSDPSQREMLLKLASLWAAAAQRSHDDAKCRDGQYDIKLDKDFKVIVMTRD